MQLIQLATFTKVWQSEESKQKQYSKETILIETIKYRQKKAVQI